MPTTYREKFTAELDMIPETMLPQFYRVFHALIKEMVPLNNEQKFASTSRKSLHGIWGGGSIDDSLVIEAKCSLFPYEKSDSVP
jgi:hypothetical protein